MKNEGEGRGDCVTKGKWQIKKDAGQGVNYESGAGLLTSGLSADRRNARPGLADDFDVGGVLKLDPHSREPPVVLEDGSGEVKDMEGPPEGCLDDARSRPTSEQALNVGDAHQRLDNGMIDAWVLGWSQMSAWTRLRDRKSLAFSRVVSKSYFGMTTRAGNVEQVG